MTVSEIKTGASLRAVFLTPKSHFTMSSPWLLGGCLKTERGGGEIKGAVECHRGTFISVTLLVQEEVEEVSESTN